MGWYQRRVHGLQKEHPITPEATLAKVNEIQPGSLTQQQQQDRLFEFYQRLNIKGIGGHFFPITPGHEVFGPADGKSFVRAFQPHSMLTCKGRWFVEQNYKADW